MLLQLVELTPVEGQEAAFEAALCEARQRVFMSAGFRGFTVHQGTGVSPTYLVQVQWETREELDAFVAGRFEGCWAPVEPYLARMPRVEHLVERPGLGLHGPGVVTDLTWLSEGPPTST
jgi:heme-degrading monooxygenase HmoA